MYRMAQNKPASPAGVTYPSNVQGGTEQTEIFNLSTEFTKICIKPLTLVVHRELRRHKCAFKYSVVINILCDVIADVLFLVLHVDYHTIGHLLGRSIGSSVESVKR